MLRHPLRATLVCALACTIAACSTLYVKSDVNTALIGQVHCNSFAWAGSFRGNSPLRDGIANPINESRLRSAIATHLKGPIEDAPGNADCLLGYGIGATRAVDWPYGYGWGYYGYWGWPGPYVYPEGIIAVDMYDARRISRCGTPPWIRISLVRAAPRRRSGSTRRWPRSSPSTPVETVAPPAPAQLAA